MLACCFINSYCNFVIWQFEFVFMGCSFLCNLAIRICIMSCSFYGAILVPWYCVC